MFDHLEVRSALSGLGNHNHLIGILVGNEALRNDDEHPDRGYQSKHEHADCRSTVLENPGKSYFIHMQHSIEEALGRVIENAMLLLGWRPQEATAKHWRQGDGNHARDQDGDANRNRKFLE